MGNNSKYLEDGVDVKLGDDFSKFASDMCRATFNNSPFVNIHDLSKGFRGPRPYEITSVPKGYFVDIAPDGVGTKVIIIDSAESYRNAYQDVYAMTAGDITRYGGLPVIFSSVLDVNTLGEPGSETYNNFAEMIRGLGDLAKEQKIVVLKGETAELGACVGSTNPMAKNMFNIAGFATGIFHPDKMITGKNIADGQIVIALREYGFRSNGISSVRKALEIKHGPDWYKKESAKADVLACSTPSTLYDIFLSHLSGWYGNDSYVNVHAIAHITGGGIVGKLAEDFLKPKELSAYLFDLFNPPAIMDELKEVRGMSNQEVYGSWNGGQGVLLVVDRKDMDRVIMLAKKFNIEAQFCGHICKEDKPNIKIRSKFSTGEKNIVHYL
ncbi:MAG: AIR synthase-related protein [Candidatus Nomurabacteria bacterium]|nr:AIR synthase-related protein [Candidatus Nomurabacteria bacterium]